MSDRSELFLITAFAVILIVLGSESTGGYPGGWTDITDVNDEYVTLAIEALKENLTKQEKYDFEEDDLILNNLNAENQNVEIHASSQVVAGMNYRITFDFGNGIRCYAIIWMKPWKNSKEVVEENCGIALNLMKINEVEEQSKVIRRKRESSESLMGGMKQLDTSEPDVLDALDYSFQAFDLNRMSNSMYMFAFDRIVSASSQVVAGIKYEIQVDMRATNCRNNKKNYGKMLDECPFNESYGKVQRCAIRVLHQAWMEPQYSLIGQPECHIISKRKTVNVDAQMTQQALLGGDGLDLGSYGAFTQFKATFGRTYIDDKEEQFRFSVFQKNMRKAAQLQKMEKGTARYGASKFADVTPEEFRKYSTSGRWDLSHNPSLKPAVIPETPAPPAWDWRNHSAVTEVKNQGMCGSCWAFSTTGNIEGLWAIKKQQLVSLSEQELVDCDKLDEGCNGGLPSQAYEEIIRLGGLETETEYPYDAKDEKCKFAPSDVRVYINGSLNISSDEGEMAAWLAQNGPISIGINAMAMQFYMGGISHPFSFLCSPAALDHGVLIVGYDTKVGILRNKPYWIVKNSWGPDWGVKGYYLVYRGAGVCGLNKMPTSAVVG